MVKLKKRFATQQTFKKNLSKFQIQKFGNKSLKKSEEIVKFEKRFAKLQTFKRIFQAKFNL